MGKKAIPIIMSFLIKSLKAVLPYSRGACRFYPSCSEYAIEALEKKWMFEAIILIIKRIIKCNPFGSKWGYDPVE